MLKSAAQYGLAKGLSGAVNLLAIALYTRIVAPSDYGCYSLIIVFSGIVNAFAFQWLRQTYVRFSFIQETGDEAGKAVRLYTVLTSLIVALLIVSSVILGELMLFEVAVIVAAQALYEIKLEALRVSGRSGEYLWASLIKAVAGLALGFLFCFVFKLGCEGLVLALVVSFALPFIVLPQVRLATAPLRGIKDAEVVLSYGVPLIGSMVFSYTLAMSDRVIISLLMGKDAVGTYVPAYDFSSQTVGMAMMIINLVLYPLILKAYAESRDKFDYFLGVNKLLLVAASGPIVMAQMVFSGLLSDWVFGSSYAQVAAMLLPVVALSACLDGARAYHFDLKFQAAGRTRLQLKILAAAAVLNAGLNFALIPWLGVLGAAIATLIAYAVALFLSAFRSAKIVSRESPRQETRRILSVYVVSIVGMLLVRKYMPDESLLMDVAGGLLLAFASLLGAYHAYRSLDLLRGEVST